MTTIRFCNPAGRLFVVLGAALLIMLRAAAQAPAVPSWNESAKAWEEAAARHHEIGEAREERDALVEAARAWDRAAELWRPPANENPNRVNELEAALADLAAPIAARRRSAFLWRECGRLARAAGDEEAAALASGQAAAALEGLVELEDRFDRWSRILEEKRRTLIDRPVSTELQESLIERWIEVARSWEMTALTHDRAGESSKAMIARMKAEESRARIREIKPGIDEGWLAERTMLGRAAPIPAPAPLPSTTPARPESPQTTPPAPPLSPAHPEQAVEIPELPPPATLPPDWLLTAEERDAVRSARVWRQSAEAWRRTALARAAEANRDSALIALDRMMEATERRRAIEATVRTGYARREAELSRMVASAFRENPRTEEEILARLDAGPAAGPRPPSIAGDVVALAPPALPDDPTETRPRRGFFDLEIGGPIPSTLTIRGRKVVSVDYNVTSYLKEDASRSGGNSQSSFNLNQELQVEVLGRVGSDQTDHINVNIRYDDTQRGVNSVNNRTIAVDFVGVPHKTRWGTYQYDVDFGDISFSLPGSEFAFYNKSLFGVRGDLTITDLNLGPLKADRIGLILLGSQTKGVSASKEFTMSGEKLPPEQFKDKDFVRDRFFFIEPDATRLPISQVVVYRDDAINTFENNLGAAAFSAAGAGPAAGYTHNGTWNTLVAGQDYILNQTTGELELLSYLGPNDHVAVAYSGNGVLYGGGTPPRIIRVPTDSPAARVLFRAHEARNRYRLSRQRIKKDDPNFVFEIRDAMGFTQTTVGGVPTTYLRLFGFDRDGDDKVDIELIDYDFGVIRPIDTAPFMRTGNATIDNAAIYTKNDLTDADHKYTIHVEYASDQPQEIFILGFDIIKNSDIVTVDGKRAERDADYFIDYEAGIITFLNRALLTPNSTIRVDYEYLPFGGQFERTIVGTRLDVNINPKLSFGTTLLYDFSAAAEDVPSVFEDKPNQNAIVEIDANLAVAPLLFDLLDRSGSSPRLAKMRDNFRLNFGGEWAWATHDPNTFGAVMIEDFESIEEVVGVGFGRTSWAWAAAPNQSAEGLEALTGLQASRGTVGFAQVDNMGHISQALITDKEQRQSSLRFDVGFTAGETWIAIRQPLSPAALDFTSMSVLELFASGLPATCSFFVDVGLISEDADGDGVLDSEDADRNGILNTGEDMGIRFNPPGSGKDIIFGAADGHLTTEDMDGDFVLDQFEAFFRTPNLNANAEVERRAVVGLNNSNWTLFRVPWRLKTAVGAADSAAIKHLRLVIQRTPGLDTSFSFLMDQMTFRGNRFRGVTTETSLVLYPRNNENDPNFVRQERGELKGTTNRIKEQALGLRWSLVPGESTTVRQGYQRRIDIEDYARLSFFLAGDAKNETFSLFLVSDPENYIEIRKRIDWGSDIGGLQGAAATPLWRRIDVQLDPIRAAIIGAILGGVDSAVIRNADHEIFILGQPALLRSPSLANINQIWMRVHNGTATTDSGEVWLNDIYAAEPSDQSAVAQKATFSTGWGDLWSLTGSWRDVPGTFHGVGIISNPQTGRHENRSSVSRSLSGSLALHRLLPASWRVILPLTASWNQSTTNLDATRVDNALKSDLGRTISENQAYTATVQIWNLPSVNVNYARATASRNFRLDDYTSQSSNLAANTAYSFIVPPKLFGVIPTGKFLSLNSSYSFSDARLKTIQAASSAVANAQTRTQNQNASFGATSRPVDALSLSYDYTTAFLDRQTLLASEGWRGITMRGHRTSANLTLPTRFGFSPGVSFSGNYSENFQRATFGGRNKDLSLGGDFRINVGVNPAAWTKLLSFLTLRYSYGLSSNASYRAVNTGTSINDVFGDYVGERLFPWGSSKRVGMGTSGVTANRSGGSTNIAHNISGDIRSFAWLNTSYSAGLTRNEVASLSTLSITDGINATLNFRMDYNQAFPRSIIKFRSSYITAAVGYGRTENASTRSNSISPSMNWNAQWTDALNTTFTMGYNRATSISLGNATTRSVSEALNPSLNFTYYFDLKVPEALSVPGIGQLGSLNRRIQLGGGFNASFRETTSSNKKTAEQHSYGANLSLGYRISNNLELSASTSGSWLQDKLVETNDYFNIGAGARVEWRF